MAIGIMQGRLVPPTGNRIQCFPRDRWRDEFALARDAGLDAIEWIYDVHGADVNPISTDDGLALIARLSSETGVEVRSVCADYFMDRPFVRAAAAEINERKTRLIWLIGRCAILGVRRIVLPFVDASRIESDDEFESVVSILDSVILAAEGSGVELHLETSLSPERFAALLARLPHPTVQVNYDSGNSASLGYHPDDEFSAYGFRVGSVHIKDRVLGGGSVPILSGDTDFDAMFRRLAQVDYGGDYVLQVARGPSGDEVAWARANRTFVVERMTGSG